MHERLEIEEFNIGALKRILINFRVTFDVWIKIFVWPHLSMYTKYLQKHKLNLQSLNQTKKLPNKPAATYVSKVLYT